jgi:hypothetical protein
VKSYQVTPRNYFGICVTSLLVTYLAKCAVWHQGSCFHRRANGSAGAQERISTEEEMRVSSQFDGVTCGQLSGMAILFSKKNFDHEMEPA